METGVERIENGKPGSGEIARGHKPIVSSPEDHYDVVGLHRVHWPTMTKNGPVSKAARKSANSLG